MPPASRWASAEDARICGAEEAMIRGTVWSCEMTGNETIVTCHVGQDTVVVRADKSFWIDMNAPVNICVDPANICYFDAVSGDRIRN